MAASGFVYGPTSSNNLGDRAQLTCTVERLRASFPGWRLVAIANSVNDVADLDDLDVSYTAIRYLTSPITVPGLGIRLPRQGARLLRALLLSLNARQTGHGREPRLLSEAGLAALAEMEESSALFLSGAGTFNDLYALSVGGFWGILVHSMSGLGKPVVASGQQVGPLARLSRRVVAGSALRRVDLLGVRDPVSVRTARDVGVPPARIVLTGDDAWDLPPAPTEVAEQILEQQGVDGPFIAAQLRFGRSVGWDADDASRFASSLGRLAEELVLPVVFVPCMIGRGADDRSAAEEVRRHLRVPSTTLTEDLDARAVKAVLGRASVGVGTANHFCVFAASMGTPVVGLYATPYMEQKLTGLAGLSPDRVTDLTKDAGLNPLVLTAAARGLVDRRTARSSDAPIVRAQSDAAVRFLNERLDALRVGPARERP